ncbi:PhoH family protein [Chitinivibrio alkaliphilus]|uniref:PhoH-like ATPase n=1 Tax=Chitinivibrio alkaliphilus ACht1 TaxID=1313304 RepID=U7D950_9BACT|nr:PhoH family protein [Chitinivibrio alkaliphilus]ERP32111.1 PhoH-like ATPase [Chitinivibrio alkaliphilus ACht1]
MKTFRICDDSVFCADSMALNYVGNGATLVIPFGVLESLRRKQTSKGVEGRNCREFFSLLKQKELEGCVGTAIQGDTSILIWRESKQIMKEVTTFHTTDNVSSCLVAAAFELGEETDCNTVIVTANSLVHIIVGSFSLSVEYFRPRPFRAEDVYPGCGEVQLSSTMVSALADGDVVPFSAALFPNQYYKAYSPDGAYAYGRYDAKSHSLVPLLPAASTIPGWISPRNSEQTFALDALLNDQISLVSLVGQAGTGKTLLALAVGLYKSLDDMVYNKVLVSRPTMPLGNDLGFLPGSVEDKLGPWMHPIADNVEYLLKNKKVGRANLRNFEDLLNMDFIVTEPLSFIRGRSIHNQFLIVDEAQNLSLHELKTILTRAGKGTKIILAGDPYQIDAPYLTTATSGFVQIVKKFRDESIAAHITLKAVVRSILAERAATIL